MIFFLKKENEQNRLKATLLVVYESIRGIKNFIVAAKEAKKIGIKATGIQLDSGDLYELSVIARRILDEAGLSYVKIFAMSNLDEWKVAALEKKKAPIDIYAGTTELLAPRDAPTLELVYKLAEIRQAGKIVPKMKTSTKKISLPGQKQVYRQLKRNKYLEDIIGLESEKISGKKLLVPIIKKGKLVSEYPKIESIRRYYQSEIKKFDSRLLSVTAKVKYPVKISPELRQLTRKTKREIKKRHS